MDFPVFKTTPGFVVGHIIGNHGLYILTLPLRRHENIGLFLKKALTTYMRRGQGYAYFTDD